MPKQNPPMSRGGAPAQQVSLEHDTETHPVRPLVFEERQKLRQIFDDPIFRKAWHNAQAAKPSLFPQGMSTERSVQIANDRLHQLQGWDLFRVALLREMHERPLAAPKVEDNFPDAGTIEAEMKRRMKLP